ncbi:hypothetical protein D9M72_459930 [compost metagenome]
MVEEVGEAHHHQEGTAEGGDRQVRIIHDAGIFFRLGRRQNDRVDRADARRDNDDEQRKDDTHAEDGDDDAPGQEAVLPFRGHVLQLVGIDDRIVE